MAKLSYVAIASLDGFVNDQNGNFDWCMPDEQVHAFVNDLERPVGTYLYGRRLYEVMTGWDHIDPDGTEDVVTRDFARLWQAADKIVFSSTLDEVSTRRTRIERSFDPAAITRLKAEGVADLTVGGPQLAGQAIRSGLVDECRLLLSPILIGAGTPALPSDYRAELELLDQRRFDNGVIHLHYRLGN